MVEAGPGGQPSEHPRGAFDNVLPLGSVLDHGPIPERVKQIPGVWVVSVLRRTPFRPTAACGPKGIRTPDLLAASQTGLNGVLTSESPGHERAERPMLSAETGRNDPHAEGPISFEFEELFEGRGRRERMVHAVQIVQRHHLRLAHDGSRCATLSRSVLRGDAVQAPNTS